jgi:hypothetical protein
MFSAHTLCIILAITVAIMSLYIVIKSAKKSVEGYYQDENVVPKCDKGYILQTQNNQCTCMKLPSPSCPTGFTFDKNFGCKADVKCPADYSMQTDEKGKTICKADPIIVAPSCPEGGELGVNNSFCRRGEICPAGFNSVELMPGCCLPDGVTDTSQCPI